MAAPTLNSQGLGNVQSIIEEKNANIQQIPMPLSDSNETINFDMMGVTKAVTVMGNWTGSSVVAVKASGAAIFDICNGDQSTVAFSSDATGTISGMVSSVVVNWDVGGVEVVCGYTIKILEGE